MIDDGTRSRMMDAIRQAFARGESADGEELLAAALDAGLPWDMATRAVAEGVASRFDMPPPPPPSSGQNPVLV